MAKGCVKVNSKIKPVEDPVLTTLFINNCRILRSIWYLGNKSSLRAPPRRMKQTHRNRILPRV